MGAGDRLRGGGGVAEETGFLGSVTKGSAGLRVTLQDINHRAGQGSPRGLLGLLGLFALRFNFLSFFLS